VAPYGRESEDRQRTLKLLPACPVAFALGIGEGRTVHGLFLVRNGVFVLHKPKWYNLGVKGVGHDPLQPGAKTLSGTPLCGDRLMRLVYMDESGIAPHEPYMVMTGVMIEGDTQLVAVENHLDILVQKHIPENDRDGFIFHATDIWSGKKYFEDRNKWPWEKRFPILEDLSKIPRHFDLPVAWAFVEKAAYPPPPLSRSKYTDKEIDVAMHVSAFTDCALVVEVAMREIGTEIALLIAEDRDLVRTAVKQAHAWYRSKTEIVKFGLDKNNLLPFRHIRDTVHYAKKRGIATLAISRCLRLFPERTSK
jgi:hypothetical protein